MPLLIDLPRAGRKIAPLRPSERAALPESERATIARHSPLYAVCVLLERAGYEVAVSLTNRRVVVTTTDGRHFEMEPEAAAAIAYLKPRTAARAPQGSLRHLMRLLERVAWREAYTPTEAQPEPASDDMARDLAMAAVLLRQLGFRVLVPDGGGWAVVTTREDRSFRLDAGELLAIGAQAKRSLLWPQPHGDLAHLKRLRQRALTEGGEPRPRIIKGLD